MKKEQFYEFIVAYELYGAEDLIEVTFKDGAVHKAIWMQTLDALEESQDGEFKGKPEQELFFLMDKNDYYIVPVEEIDQVRCLQQTYLKGLTYQLKQ